MSDAAKVLKFENKEHHIILDEIENVIRRLHTKQIHNRDKLDLRHIAYFAKGSYQTYPIIKYSEIYDEINQSGVKDIFISQYGHEGNDIEKVNESKFHKELHNVLNTSLIGKNKFWRFDENDPFEALQIIDSMAIPESFVHSYFGLDTGLDGLNLLFKGGMILPEDRPCYIAINGESGAGKTNLALKLITAIYQNDMEIDYADKKKDINKYEIHYFLIEQSHKNLKRIIQHFNMLRPKGIGDKETVTFSENDIEQNQHFQLEYESTGKPLSGHELFIYFHPVDMYSSGQLMQKISAEIKGHNNNHRQIFVIDSVNALMDSQLGTESWRQELQAIKAITKSQNSKNEHKDIKNNPIVVFVQEKSDLSVSNNVDYTSDVVIQIHEEITATNKNRCIEIVKSRFQDAHFGKHPIFFTDSRRASILVYPQTDTMHHIMRAKSIPIEFDDKVKEFGVKIDGIENIYNYMHRSSHDEKPVIVKNSLTLLSGERGCFKTRFAELFARSAFRDEHHFRTKIYDNNHYYEFDDNKEKNSYVRSNPISTHYYEQIKLIHQNIEISEESVCSKVRIELINTTNRCSLHVNACAKEEEDYYSLFMPITRFKKNLYFPFERNSIPSIIVYGTRIVTNDNAFIVTDLDHNDQVKGLKICEDIIDVNVASGSGTIGLGVDNQNKLCFIKEETDDTFDITKSKISSSSLIELDFRLRPVVDSNEEFKFFSENSSTYSQDKAISVLVSFGETYTFSPHDKVMETFFGRLVFVCTGAKEKEKDRPRFINVSMIVVYFEIKNYTEDVYFQEIITILRALKQYRISDVIPTSYGEFIHDARFSLINRTSDSKTDEVLLPEEYNPYNSINQADKPIDDKFKYNYVDSAFCIRITRMVIDNCANMDSIFKTINYRKFLTSISHYCLSNNISTFFVNTISHGEDNEINRVCNSLADNVIQFRKVSLKGTWLASFRILRSTNNRHSGMLRQIVQKRDSLLALKDSFPFNSNFDEPGQNMLGLKLIMPGSTPGLKNYTNLFKHVQDDEHKTLNNAWYNRMRELLKTSLCHNIVQIQDIQHELTDAMVLLEDNTYKDSCTIICLPGHLLRKYDGHLVPVSDYIQFYPKVDAGKLYTNEFSGVQWGERFGLYYKKEDKDKDKERMIFLGKINPTLHQSSVLYANCVKEKEISPVFIEPNNPTEPNTIFEPTLALKEDNKKKSDPWHIDGTTYHSYQVNAMPYYFDPRLVLSFGNSSTTEVIGCVSKETLTVLFLEEYLIDNDGWAGKIIPILKNTAAFRIALSGSSDKLNALSGKKIRDYYSNHMELLSVLCKINSSDKNIKISFSSLDIMICNTWYLAVPADSPRQGTACEIITSLTKPNELELLRTEGIGLPFCANLHNTKNKENNFQSVLKQIPCYNEYTALQVILLSDFPCFNELVASIGGYLYDLYRLYECGNTECIEKEGSIYKDIDKVIKDMIRSACERSLCSQKKDKTAQCKHFPNIFNE